MEKVPVFIRLNSIYVTGILLDGNSRLWGTDRQWHELRVFAFPRENDDTAVFNFVDHLDSSSEKRFAVAGDENGVDYTIPTLLVNGELLVRLARRPSMVSMNGSSVTVDWDETLCMVRISLQKNTDNKVFIKR